MSMELTKIRPQQSFFPSPQNEMFNQEANQVEIYTNINTILKTAGIALAIKEFVLPDPDQLLNEIFNKKANQEEINTKINTLLIKEKEKEIFASDNKPKEMQLLIWNFNRLTALLSLRHKDVYTVKKGLKPGTFTVLQNERFIQAIGYSRTQ